MSRNKRFFLLTLVIMGMASSSLACGNSEPSAPEATPIVETGVEKVDGAVETLTEAVADGNICDLGKGPIYCTTHPTAQRCSLVPANNLAALNACTPKAGEEALYDIAVAEAEAEVEAAK